MGRDSTFYGRNPLKEALIRKLPISRIYIKGSEDRRFAEKLLNEHGLSKDIIQAGLPSHIMREAHQGLAFEAEYDFYIESAQDISADKFPRILLCNHLQDIQNLGALARSAAAFGFGLIVHETRRSFRLNPAAVKVSMGYAFHLKFLEVPNLLAVCQRLKKLQYFIAGLEAESSINLYEWRADFPLALLVGSEGEGISKPLKKAMDYPLRIPMVPNIESLNVVQAASIAMSWIHQGFAEFSVARTSRTN